MITNIALHLFKDDIDNIDIKCNDPKLGPRYWTLAITKGAYIYIDDAEFRALLVKMSNALEERGSQPESSADQSTVGSTYTISGESATGST